MNLHARYEPRDQVYAYLVSALSKDPLFAGLEHGVDVWWTRGSSAAYSLRVRLSYGASKHYAYFETSLGGYALLRTLPDRHLHRIYNRLSRGLLQKMAHVNVG